MMKLLTNASIVATNTAKMVAGSRDVPGPEVVKWVSDERCIEPSSFVALVAAILA